jgi:hypothetical protein
MSEAVLDGLAFDRLAGLRVMFGHQSVGGNILEGVRDILATQQAGGWQMLHIADSAEASGGFLAHGRVGRNGDPRSKTQEFCEAVAGPIGARIDVAFHKYCYADIDAHTDVDALFFGYREAMSELRAERPNVTLVHMTVPLVRVRTGPRAWLKRAIGRKSPRVADNARREAFNDWLRREYTAREPLFDLAALESRSNGTRSLRADYTDDGGHLNGAGRRHVAGELLALLADLPRRS